ncbi:MAG: hypothetical protein ACLFST_00080 [Spirochaetia bacterium]
MAVYEKTVKTNKADILNKAKKFFGPGGEGLVMTGEEDCCLSFEGGGGHVAVALSDTAKGKVKVEAETREWDYQVRQFLSSI